MFCKENEELLKKTFKKKNYSNAKKGYKCSDNIKNLVFKKSKEILGTVIHNVTWSLSVTINSKISKAPYPVL